MIIGYHNVTESVKAAYEYRRIPYVESDLFSSWAVPCVLRYSFINPIKKPFQEWPIFAFSKRCPYHYSKKDKMPVNGL